MFLTLMIILISQSVSLVNIGIETNSRPVVTQWVGPGKPSFYQSWILDKTISENFQIGEIYSTGIESDSLLEIIITSDLYPQIYENLQILISDIENEGYQVFVDTISSNQGIHICDSLRNYLYQRLGDGLIGVFFIGDVPIAWYQLVDDFGYGASFYEEFPIDLFYMDLDGIWSDDSHYVSGLHLTPGSDDIYDGHTGNVSPEIFVGRLYFSTLGNEAELVNKYLIKDHLYRTDSLSAVNRGLCFVDDDWEIDADLYTQEMSYAYPNIITISNPESTRVSNYVNELQDNYELVGIYCHSSPFLHAFTINNGTGYDLFYATNISEISPAPPGIFYNLYACSNARYIENGFMGGMYITRTPKGLGAIGSTKTGAMLDFYYFYQPLGQNNSFGEAFKLWYQQISNNGFNIIEKSYHYGMTFIGDPTLKLNEQGPYLFTDGILINDSTGNNDGRLDPGESAEINFYIKNHYDAEVSENVTGELYCTDNDITINNSTSSFGNILPGDSSINSTPFSVQVSSNAENHITSFTLYLSDGLSGKVFSDTFYVYIGREPILLIDDDGSDNSEEACIESLDSLNFGWELIERDTFNNFDYSYLLPYQAVIWITGSQAESTLIIDDQNAIEEHFNNNGNILIYGQNIAEDLQGSSFLQNFLKVNWVGNSSEYFQDGIVGDLIGNNLQIAVQGQSSKDIIIPLSGAIGSFSYRIGGDSISMVHIEGNGKLLFAGFDFNTIVSTIPNYASRDTIFARIFDYFGISTSVEELPTHVSDNKILNINNFVYSSNGISFTVMSNINSITDIIVYNILGSPVKIVYRGILDNNRNFHWDYTNNRGENISSGIYFIKLSTVNNSISKKLFIIK